MGVKERAIMASAGARAYNGGLGCSPQRGPEAEPLVKGSPPEAEKLFAFRRPLEAANLPLFSLDSVNYLNFQSNTDSGRQTWESLGFAFTT